MNDNELGGLSLEAIDSILASIGAGEAPLSSSRDIDWETQALYRELARMSLSSGMNNNNDNNNNTNIVDGQFDDADFDMDEDDFFDESDIPENADGGVGDDDVPPYLYCQPCEGGSLADAYRTINRDVPNNSSSSNSSSTGMSMPPLDPILDGDVFDDSDKPSNADDEDDDGPPAYMSCQPCEGGSLADTYRNWDVSSNRSSSSNNNNTSSSNNHTGGGIGMSLPPLDRILPPVAEEDARSPDDDEAESELVRQDQERHIRDLQALYKMSRKKQPAQSTSSAVTEVAGGSVAVEDSDSDRVVDKDDGHNDVRAGGEMQLDRADPSLEDMEAQGSEPEFVAMETPHWWDSAQRWCKAFGVNLIRDVEKNEDQSNGGDTAAAAASASPPPAIPTPFKDTSKSCFGHKEVIYSVSFSQDGKFLCTASQDSTVGIWEVATNRLVTTLKGHSTAYECLRVDWASTTWADDILDRSSHLATLVASAGADGVVKIWSSASPADRGGWKCEFTLDHAKLGWKKDGEDAKGDGGGGTSTKDDDDDDDFGLGTKPKEDDKDKPQVYALQFIDNWKVFTNPQDPGRHRPSRFTINDRPNPFLLTSSDELIHLWEVEGHPFDEQLTLQDTKIHLLNEKIKLKEVMSLHFGPLDEYGYGVTACSVTGEGLQLPPPPTPQDHPRDDDRDEDTFRFGGERNPDNTVYVFDAAYCPTSGILGVALADGSLRLVNGRGICVSVLSLPGTRSHLTSFCWDTTGTRLATCIASGHLITWTLDWTGGDNNTVATCTAIFEGGHQAGRPLYGCSYCGAHEKDLLMSWGVDGKLCLWDSYGQGNFYSPIAVLKSDGQYPIFAVEVSEGNVAVAGGAPEAGFMGVPMYLYDVAQQKST